MTPAAVAALENLTMELQVELSESDQGLRDVVVNAVCPGVADTASFWHLEPRGYIEVGARASPHVGSSCARALVASSGQAGDGPAGDGLGFRELRVERGAKPARDLHPHATPCGSPNRLHPGAGSSVDRRCPFPVRPRSRAPRPTAM